MKLQTKIDIMRDLLVRRVEINTDNDSLRHLRQLDENNQDLFVDCQEWDDIGVCLSFRALCFLQIDEWHLKATKACESDQPIPEPPIGERMHV